MIVMRILKFIAIATCSVLQANCSSTEESLSANSTDPGGARIDVEPFLKIGTGNPGNGPDDINPPDGVLFDSRGALLLTDALNHRMLVWDVKAGRRLGEFGSAEIFHGEVVDLAAAPSGQVI